MILIFAANTNNANSDNDIRGDPRIPQIPRIVTNTAINLRIPRIIRGDIRGDIRKVFAVFATIRGREYREYRKYLRK